MLRLFRKASAGKHSLKSRHQYKQEIKREEKAGTLTKFTKH